MIKNFFVWLSFLRKFSEKPCCNFVAQKTSEGLEEDVGEGVDFGQEKVKICYFFINFAKHIVRS